MGQLRGLFRFQNVDSTKDLNDRFSGLVEKGVMDAGSTHPSGAGNVTTPVLARVVGQLAIDVQPFMAVGFDGMVVVHDGPSTRLGLAASQTQYVVVRSVYQPAGPADTAFEVFSVADWTALSTDNKAKRIILGKVTTGISQITDDSGIDLRENDIVDKTSRNFIRGVVQTNAMLPIDAPTAVKRVETGDVYLVIDDRQFYRWGGSTWDTVTDQFVASDLALHKGVNGPSTLLAGTATANNGSVNIVGIGSSYNTTLTPGDVVRFNSEVATYIVAASPALTPTTFSITTVYGGISGGGKTVTKVRLNAEHGGSVITRDLEGYPAHVARAISVVPVGAISSTDLQSALAEIDSERVLRAGDTMTGNLIMSSASIFISASGSNVGIDVLGGPSATAGITAAGQGSGSGIIATSGSLSAIAVVGIGYPSAVGTVGGKFTGGINSGQGLIAIGDSSAVATLFTGVGIIAQGGVGSGQGIIATGGAAGGGDGVVGQGNGSDFLLSATRTGIVGMGGSSLGFGVWGLGKGAVTFPAPDGSGVVGVGGLAAGKGVYGIGGSSSGRGVRGEGGTPAGDGVLGLGFGFISGTIPVANNIGVIGLGGTGDGPGGVFIGGTTNGVGLTATGTGTGNGVVGTGGTSGTLGGIGGLFTGKGINPGVTALASSTPNNTQNAGDGGHFFGGSAFSGVGSVVAGKGGHGLVATGGDGSSSSPFRNAGHGLVGNAGYLNSTNPGDSGLTGIGVLGTGGPCLPGCVGGYGVKGIGGAPNGGGVLGVADGTGIGVYGKGGGGVVGEALGNGQDGVRGLGGPSGGYGVRGFGSGSSAMGVYGEPGTGGSPSSGVWGNGNNTGTWGVRATASTANGTALYAEASGNSSCNGIEVHAVAPATEALRIDGATVWETGAFLQIDRQVAGTDPSIVFSPAGSFPVYVGVSWNASPFKIRNFTIDGTKKIFTASIDGTYLITYHLDVSRNSGTAVEVHAGVLLVGTGILRQSISKNYIFSDTNGAIPLDKTFIVSLTAGQQIQVDVWANGTNLAILTTQNSVGDEEGCSLTIAQLIQMP